MRKLVSIVIGLLVTLAIVAVATALPSLVHGDARGSFVVGCGYSHTLPDDPIRAPFRPGASHSHDFFGNVATNAMSVRSDLLGGQTTCRNGHDTAAVWSPTASLEGTRVIPLRERTYYFGRARHPVADLPEDLRMVAGNALATSPEGNPHVSWSCGGNTPEADHPYDCTPFIGDGGTVDGVTGLVDFPQCWDGASASFSATDPHVVYLEHGSCPSDHPRLIPRLRVRVHLGVVDPCVGARPCASDDTPPGNVRLTLASGPFYTLHADFWNTWDQDALDRLVDDCLREHRACGGA